MKVIGFRADRKVARYAVISNDEDNLTLLNSDSESRLQYPAGATMIGEKMAWLHRELERIFREHDDVDKVVIKTNQFGMIDTSAKRDSAYIEGVLILFCNHLQIPVETKVYASLGTKSADVKMHAEERVGKTTRYWDKQMADAIVAAWSEFRKG